MGSIPGLGRSPGGGNGTPLQHFAWRNPWTEEPGGLQSMGSKELDTTASEHVLLPHLSSCQNVRVFLQRNKNTKHCLRFKHVS